MSSNAPHKFAAGTSVPALKSRIEIETLLVKAGGKEFMSAVKPGAAVLQFILRERIIRFTLKLPDEAKYAGEYRRVWRVLLLTIKGKLEAVRDETVETFEEAFLAQTVPPGGGPTVAEQMIPQLALAYREKRPTTLLLQLPPSRGGT